MIGEILDAKYRLDRQLGAGGMGKVYLATHLGTTRTVAVKVIAPKWAADPHFLARFQREAQACGRLRHPNIVNVTDFGIAKTRHSEVAYLVMEFLDGLTLSDFQKTNPAPPLPLIADLLDQIGLALDEAHRQGIVHRDLKPDNIWLEPNQRGGYTVKVLDFGVAKMNLLGVAPFVKEREGLPAALAAPIENLNSESETVVFETPIPVRSSTARAASAEADTIAMVVATNPASTPASTPSGGSFDSDPSGQTMPGSLVGTPSYMSPEQALGKEIDFRSDIYSLAVVAYSLVCGALPFTGKTSEFLKFHETGNPPPPKSVRKLPGDVSDAILAGLARNPLDRPPSAIAFARRFRNAVDAEFLSLRRSKAFLMQRLAAYCILLLPIYAAVVSLAALLSSIFSRTLKIAGLRMPLVALVTAILFVFSDNILRASAALMAMDEQKRVRRFLSFRVLGKLIKSIPILFVTQIRSLVAIGPGWVVGDCLWPVVCMVEKKSGKAAIQRSRQLMTGLRSAGRALAIRHFALAVLALADLLKSAGALWQRGQFRDPNAANNAVWFPVFVVFAAAPLYLYDRTAGSDSGPLLRLDRTPEAPITSRPFSLSSMLWLAAGVIYLLYTPIKLWLH